VFSKVALVPQNLSTSCFAVWLTGVGRRLRWLQCVCTEQISEASLGRVWDDKLIVMPTFNPTFFTILGKRVLKEIGQLPSITVLRKRDLGSTQEFTIQSVVQEMEQCAPSLLGIPQRRAQTPK
jgi:hypothetical protein